MTSMGITVTPMDTVITYQIRIHNTYTNTQHFKYYHRGPKTPNTHPYPHTATISETIQHETQEDLDTLCDGTDPNDNYYLVSGSNSDS